MKSFLAMFFCLESLDERCLLILEGQSLSLMSKLLLFLGLVQIIFVPNFGSSKQKNSKVFLSLILQPYPLYFDHLKTTSAAAV